jgi:predicted ATP-binding protein involved in virulence
MRVISLKLANVRAIEVAEFRFQPGLNLIVGVNGVGKTSMLDALRVCLSAFVKQANNLRAPVESFIVDDIRVGADTLSVECSAQIGASEHRYLIHKPRESSARHAKAAGMPREQVHDTPEKATFLGAAPTPATGREPGGRPLAVLFSTNRAVPSDRTPRKSVVAGGTAAAFADAFANRELRLGEFAAWMRVQQALKSERASAGRALTAFDDAVSRFLPGYAHLRVDVSDARPRLLIDHGSSAVAVWQLSDGERGTLALVLDLTRRLAQANPEMSDPAAEAEAVVLIDEIDLHLHPKWQRQIVHNLGAAFPRCQFIATTHSPQVIGEVEHDRIQIITGGQVYSPTHSFGVDSSRVLEEIMDADPRAKEVTELLLVISELVGGQQFARARALLSQVSERLGETDPEVTRIRTLLDFVEGKE